MLWLYHRNDRQKHSSNEKSKRTNDKQKRKQALNAAVETGSVLLCDETTKLQPNKTVRFSHWALPPVSHSPTVKSWFIMQIIKPERVYLQHEHIRYPTLPFSRPALERKWRLFPHTNPTNTRANQ